MSDQVLSRITAEPETVQFSPIPFPEGLTPKPIKYNASPDAPLPAADVLVVTWTSAEWMALADVLTPGQHKTTWLKYAEGWKDYESQLTGRSPARQAGCMAEYQLTQIGSKRVLCMHSQLHLATDSDSAPVVQLWSQMLSEVNPDLVITTGTAGGIGEAEVLGDVFIVNSGKFNCTKNFALKPWAQRRFEQGGPVSVGPHVQYAQEHLLPINAARLPKEYTPRTPTIWASTGDVETVDYFGFSDTDDSYHIASNDPQAKTEEMDDCCLPLALSNVEGSIPWLSIRNASDPEVPSSIGTLEQQSKWASALYLKYGYWTTVGSAIACWAVICDLA